MMLINVVDVIPSYVRFFVSVSDIFFSFSFSYECQDYLWWFTISFPQFCDSLRSSQLRVAMTERPYQHSLIFVHSTLQFSSYTSLLHISLKTWSDPTEFSPQQDNYLFIIVFTGFTGTQLWSICAEASFSTWWRSERQNSGTGRSLDQPPGYGVAADCRSLRIRTQSERIW